MAAIKKLLDTMELIHYRDKFKNKIIILVVTGKVYIRDIIPDIIILQSFNIKVVLIMGYTENYKEKDFEILYNKSIDMVREISSLLKRNSLEPLSSVGNEVFSKKLKDEEYANVIGFDLETIEFALNKNKIPILMPIGIDIRGKYHKVREKDLAKKLSKELKAEYMFWVSDLDGIEINGKKYQFFTPLQVKNILEKSDLDDKKTEEILRYSLEIIDDGIKEFSIIEGKTGNIYTELLTYDISGTLISRADDEKIRKAEIEDIPAIYLLIKNEMERNNILPITEEDVEEEIEDYIVYDTDGSIVTAGKLTDYGNYVEIAKIVTLLRYQGGKKAKEICSQLIETAKEDGKEYVFGLTINPAMMKLFLSLDFKEIDREELPLAWKENYDFSRPSKAFLLKVI